MAHIGEPDWYERLKWGRPGEPLFGSYDDRALLTAILDAWTRCRNVPMTDELHDGLWDALNAARIAIGYEPPEAL